MSVVGTCGMVETILNVRVNAPQVQGDSLDSDPACSLSIIFVVA